MANDLAFFAIGIYGHELPKQHGAPIRQVIPWKYGFKGAKSIVKIEFLNYQPKTFWNELQPHEYGFEANVEPDVPHPRWSQASERMIGSGPAFTWKRRPIRCSTTVTPNRLHTSTIDDALRIAKVHIKRECKARR